MGTTSPGRLAHIVNDRLLVGLSLEDIQRKCALLTEMFELVGLAMQPEKNTYEQVPST